MAESLAATAEKIADQKQRAQWTQNRWQEIQGRELYLGHKGAITADKSVATLAKFASTKPRAEKEQTQSLLDQLAERLKTEVAAPRNPQSCKQLAGVIAATARQLKDPAQKQQWIETLSKAISGRESYAPANAKPNAKPLRDPCADTIEQLRKESESAPAAS